jgi:hypothetical protein
MQYFINVKKVGTKYMHKAYRRVRTYFDTDMVCMGYYDSDKPVGVKREHPILISVEQRMKEILTECITSGKFTRITVTIPNDVGRDTKIFEWLAND